VRWRREIRAEVGGWGHIAMTPALFQRRRTVQRQLDTIAAIMFPRIGEMEDEVQRSVSDWLLYGKVPGEWRK
jgi:hypothetical protein